MASQIVIGPPSTEEVWKSLSWWEKWRMKYLGVAISVGKYSKLGWSGELEFFIFRCRHKKLRIDYRHGFEQYLSCGCS